MRIQLERIESADTRRTAELKQDEVVAHDVTLTINDGPPRTFQVSLTALAPPHIGLLNADELLQELLRFEAAALGRLLQTVGHLRRGRPVELPMLILDACEERAR